jgi:iron complex transport system substrate-binding protein
MRCAVILLLLASFLGGCSAKFEHARGEGMRIVSLDYCADQYVLELADKDEIVALSPEAERRFSYLREKAAGFPMVRPRMADVLALRPDIVVRSYGGGPGAALFLEQAGVRVVQLGYPQDLGGVRSEVLRIGEELGSPNAAHALIEQYDSRLARLGGQGDEPLQVMYMTPTGVTAGPGTLIDEVLRAAGLANFQTRPGWNPIPLERLAYEQPDLVAASFFESDTYQIDHWSAARHPIARLQMEEKPVAMLDGAWTSCGAWFMLDAVEVLSRKRQQIEEGTEVP